MADFEGIRKELEGIAGSDRLKTDADVLAKHTVDGKLPKAVVFPKDTRMVAEIVRCACRSNLGILPWGSGTKMSAGHPPERMDLVIAMGRMNHMLDVDTANLTITVEAGVKFRDVQARLATEDDRCYLPLDDLTTESGELICSERSHSGCFLPLDPSFSDRATIGGIVAANSTGPRRLLYGLPRDLILGVRFVTPEGDIVGAGGKTVKNVSGYDISKVMIGSYGSLGILCEMTLRLLPLPEAMETLLLSFESFSAAQSFAGAVLQTKLLPAALEVANGPAFRNIPFKGVSVELKPEPYVVMVALEAAGEAVERMRKEMILIGERFGAKGHSLLKEEGHLLFWLAVSDLQASLGARFGELISLRLSYPLSEWKALFEFAENTIKMAGPECGILCHAGSGASQVHVLLEKNSGKEAETARAVASILARCRELGGNLVVLQAPTGLKKGLPVWGEPGADLLVMKRLRAKIDPQGLMSPGRFVVGA
ncbi:MAG: FAD-binding oxidoreductase [Deltaproteobacteria bacterium]|nr:FAD-binding oxidoreductase [Deltaproteobacteria bacterium]